MSGPVKSDRFNVQAIAAALPAQADTLLIETYLTDRADASARVFRVYQGTPPHYHETCDEYLYVLSGRGTFWMGEESTKAEFGSGELLFFERGTVHALPEILTNRSCSSRLARRGASRPISSLSIRRTATPQPSWPGTPAGAE